MKKKDLIRYISFVLLLAMQFGILPIYQILHKHHFSFTHDHGQPLVKKYEKPCCKPFEVIIEGIVPKIITIRFCKLEFAPYSVYAAPEFAVRFFTLSNKAPPVEIV